MKKRKNVLEKGRPPYFLAPNVKGAAALPLEFEHTVTDNDGASASDRE
jgi:hypothetical protein